jgi:hypothetical protein
MDVAAMFAKSYASDFERRDIGHGVPRFFA